MGQESYALLKVKWKKLPGRIKDMFDDEEPGGTYLVKNVALPAVLVWTGINYHDLKAMDEEEVEYLVDEVLTAIPNDLLAANVEPRGVLLFADGGEPRDSWPRKVSYDELVKEIGDAGRWLTIPADLLEEEVSSGVDDTFLAQLDEKTLFAILAARQQKDFDRIRKLLKAALKDRYPKLEKGIESWLSSLNPKR